MPTPTPPVGSLSNDEMDLLRTVQRAIVSSVAVAEPRRDAAEVEKLLFPDVLTTYRDARISGLCHEGACELARDQLQLELARYAA